ncbi:MAG: Bax inhibitor-1/YccA family protein [Oscillospiraceae bacterium]|nr:Bax inhibitor-1/YccA family protein [Oscillospiraceae bacterium]
MAYNDNPYGQQQQPSELFPSLWGDQDDIARATTSCLARVFLKMFFALLVTAGTSFAIYSNQDLLTMIFTSLPILIGLLIAQFALVIILSARVMKMSSAVSNVMFFVYALLMGVTLSVIFITYEIGVIFQAFAVSALMFGAMAIYGTITKRDLTRLGSLCFMALIGIIIASLINFFFRNEMMTMIINYIGVLVFVGLTAYDTQKVKNMLHEVNSGSKESIEVSNRDEAIKRISVIGALRLYLDFLNLFLKILAIMGRRR